MMTNDPNSEHLRAESEMRRIASEKLGIPPSEVSFEQALRVAIGDGKQHLDEIEQVIDWMSSEVPLLIFPTVQEKMRTGEMTPKDVVNTMHYLKRSIAMMEAFKGLFGIFAQMVNEKDEDED